MAEIGQFKIENIAQTCRSYHYFFNMDLPTAPYYFSGLAITEAGQRLHKRTQELITSLNEKSLLDTTEYAHRAM